VAERSIATKMPAVPSVNIPIQVTLRQLSISIHLRLIMSCWHHQTTWWARPPNLGLVNKLEAEAGMIRKFIAEFVRGDR
jgi:hypothetical protein